MPAALRQTATRDIITDYETALCERFEVKHAFATTTEQDAAKAALIVAGVTPGSEVILSVLSEYKVAASILAVGATPVFCDVYPHMFFSNAADMQRRITPKTSAIMVTGQWGTPGLGIEHEKLSKATGLPTINYATTGLGSKYGKYEGAQALVNCFGTSSGLVMNAGQGGVVLTDDEQVGEKITALGLEKPKADVCEKGL